MLGHALVSRIISIRIADIYEERINEIGLYRLGPLPGLLQLAEFPSNLFDSDAPTEVVVAITDGMSTYSEKNIL